MTCGWKGKKRERVGPCIREDTGGAEVAVGMVGGLRVGFCLRRNKGRGTR